MPVWNKGWIPATVGEAREYLDAHETDGDPAIVEACEAKIDVIERCSGHGGSWGVRKEFFEVAIKVGKPAARQAARAA